MGARFLEQVGGLKMTRALRAHKAVGKSPECPGQGPHKSGAEGKQ